MKTDVVIIGGGIVGLATAWKLSEKHPNLSISLLEKENGLAKHQTGHNSGVLHSGIYYKPNSLKAQNCRLGKKRMEDFCRENDIPHEICGKVIVATEQSELNSLHNIYQRGQANGVECRLIDQSELMEREPHCNGIKAILVPEAGIVNYKAVCEKLSELFLKNPNNSLHLNTKVENLFCGHSENRIETNNGTYHSKVLINCAGLYSDHVAQLSDQKVGAKIIPFRGEYFELKPEAQNLCKHLIYPVPDPSFPFLGVHFTRMIEGSVECGPNAVLAFAREGYGKLQFNFPELLETLSYPGFQKLAAKYWKTGAGEMWRSFCKDAFVKALQKLVPSIRAEHLVPVTGGIRAQAVKEDGGMVDDFLILQQNRVVNVCNAPSPAATSSLSIAEYVVSKVECVL